MSLALNLSNFATRVAAEVKLLKGMISGGASNLSALTTTQKSSLVSAVNELKSLIDSTDTGSGGSTIDDASVSSSTTWSSSKTDSEISSRLEAQGPVVWNDIEDKPATFPPSEHSHTVVWSDVQDKPSVFPSDQHEVSWADVQDKPESFPPSEHSHTVGWVDIEDKPAAFPPTEHSHTVGWTDIEDKPAAFPPTEHSHAVGWSDVQDKPESFHPSEHSHTVVWTDVQNKPTSFPPAAHEHAGMARIETVLDFADITSPEPGVLYIKVEP